MRCSSSAQIPNATSLRARLRGGRHNSFVVLLIVILGISRGGLSFGLSSLFLLLGGLSGQCGGFSICSGLLGSGDGGEFGLALSLVVGDLLVEVGLGEDGVVGGDLGVVHLFLDSVGLLGSTALGENSGAVVSGGLTGGLLGGAHLSSVRVECEHDILVLQRVALDLHGHPRGWLGSVEFLVALDLGRVDDARDVGVHDAALRQLVALLGGGDTLAGSPDLGELGESGFRPDDEAAHVASRSELEQVEALDISDLDAGDVAERLGDALVF
mmetsp:Transcript_8256/g.15317  ORF Transcript_8256/g.15317 Transcript_8256/m.15317 type:complete len:270 (-) Transcript_8256:714-1523(-)